jgi:hypothetical protein
LGKQPRKSLTACRLNEGVVVQRSGWDVLGSSYDVVIAGQHDRNTFRQKFGGMGDEALEPRQLVIELWPGLRIAIGEIKGRDQDSVHRYLDVPSLEILGIARQA